MGQRLWANWAHPYETQNETQMKTAKKRKGALAIEYAVLVAGVVAALLGMQTYIKRAICGRWRAAADTFGHGRQYEPGVTVEE